MEIKKLDNTILDSEHNSTTTTTTTTTDKTNATFSETLNQVISKSTSTKTSNEEIANLQNDNKTIGILRIDKLPKENKEIVLKAIDSLNNIFDINILQNKDKFFNEDSQIKIRDIIGEYGDNVTSNDLNDFGITINKLLDNGMISNDDYFYALKWMALKREQFKVKLQMESNKNHANDLMFKPKKSEHQII